MGMKNSTFKLRLMTGAATGMALLAATTTSAIAQDDDEDVITVTGIRSSIENSLETKRDAAGIVEAISAEDIGKLPDLSIADALARLPGVTAQRVRGRSQQISIRGLGPDFSLALLNGREVVSAGNNRGVEFDQFPSELINQGLVYKTPDATLAATGIAGAVDLRTIRPLDFKGRKINLSGKYVLNSEDQLNPDFDNDGYRFFASYIDQNDDGTVGWSIAITEQSNPTQFTSRELKTGRFQVGRDANGIIYPADNPRQGAVSREFSRTSVAGSLQFEPNDRFQATLDAFYTDTEDAGIFRGTETPIASWSGASFDSATGTGPFADTATYSAVVPILRTDTEGNTAEIFAWGGNFSYEASDRLTLMADISGSTLDRNDIDYESYAGTGAARSGAQDTLIFNFDPDGEYSIQSTIDYTDPGTVLLTDPGGWGQVGFIKQPIIEDELNQLRLEADYDLDKGFISGVKVGYLRSDREKNFDSNEGFLRSNASYTNGSLAIPSSSIVGQTDAGSLGLDIISYDPSSFLTDGTYTYEKGNFDTQWVVEETLDTFYAMADVDTMWGEVPVTGNFGFQYVLTDQSSTGTLAGTGTQTVSEDYSDFLPSLNLKLEVMPDNYIRFAAAKSITRARLDQMAANQSISTNPQSCTDTDSDQIPDTLVSFNPPTVVCFGLGGGNPSLQPYESTSYDLSWERYFSSTSAVSVALFHKDLSDWIIDFSTLVDGSDQIRTFGAGAFLDANPQVALSTLGGPVNFSDGSITGVEATVRMDLADWSEKLDGFGFSASFTHAAASIEDQNGQEIDIPGYSENIWSGDVYYDKYGWQAKFSARHRDGFLSEVQNFDGSLSGADAEEELILDAQIGYTWDQGPLDGFGVNFEVFNLGNEPFVTQEDLFDAGGTNVVGTFPSRYEEYGRTYNFTITKEF